MDSRIGIGVSFQGLGLGEPYTPNRSVTALVAQQGLVFVGAYVGVWKERGWQRLERIVKYLS